MKPRKSRNACTYLQIINLKLAWNQEIESGIWRVLLVCIFFLKITLETFSQHTWLNSDHDAKFAIFVHTIFAGTTRLKFSAYSFFQTIAIFSKAAVLEKYVKWIRYTYLCSIQTQLFYTSFYCLNSSYLFYKFDTRPLTMIAYAFTSPIYQSTESILAR